MLLQRALAYTGVMRGKKTDGARQPAEVAGDCGEEQPDGAAVFGAAGEVESRGVKRGEWCVGRGGCYVGVRRLLISTGFSWRDVTKLGHGRKEFK